MSTSATVRLWGTDIGYLTLAEGGSVAAFEYEPVFLSSGIEVSPLVMPLTSRVYRFPELAPESFHGLPGLLADSLPDAFGHAVIDAWLATQGRAPESFNAVERLCVVGTRGMGALEFHPALRGREDPPAALPVARLVELASEILSHRASLATRLTGREGDRAVAQILRVGTSAGGARAKAIIAWNPATHEVRSGQIEAGQGFESWLMKFDGVRHNRDRELADPQGYGAIELAYARMAGDAGITMMPCRLYEENGRRHFMTRRFDRTAEGDKVQVQSLAALAHFDFRRAGAYGYEQALQVMRALGLGADELEQQVRRMVFNIVARNQNDHVKNIGLLMDRRGRWSLSPAYDVTYSYNPQGAWTSAHQMTVNGKRDGFTREDFDACGRMALLKRGRIKALLGEVQEVVARWPAYAEEAGVAPDWRASIAANLRLRAFS